MDRSDSVDNPCTVCHDAIQVYAVGPCDHPVCYKCSTRMRVLCEQMDCPICRGTMLQVAFVYEKQLFKDINLRDCIPNRKNKIFYETEEIEDKYLDLLEFRCRQCPKRNPERTFAQLQTHMRREHQLFACDICLAHLRIFPYETKFYDRKNLAVHRRMGDVDDKSYKGHPLCEFCDTRYLDKDELMKHLRQDHFFCHFCDQECSNAYYNDYPDLLVHFRDGHFLCTEDECGDPSTRFTHAFSSEIDLKSHKTTVHNRKSRETRTIGVDFQYAPRHQGYSRGSGLNSDDYEDSGSQRQRNRGDRYGNRRRQHDDPNLQRALEASLQESVDAKERPPVQERVPDPIHDFPTLSGAPAVQTQSVVESQRPSQKPVTNAKKVEDFPTLGSSNGNGKKAQNPSKNYAAITHYTSEPRPVVKEKVRESQPVSLGTVKPVNKDRWTVHAPKVTEDDYPTLMGRNKAGPRHMPSGGGSSSSWLQKAPVVEVPTPVSVTPTVSVIKDRPSEPDSKPRRPTPVMRPISDENEFPTLGGGEQRQELVPLNNLWAKQKSSTGTGRKSSQMPKSEKVDDKTFELPDSYYKSYDQPEQHQAKDKLNGEGGSSSKSSKKNVTIDKKDFPGLPNREVENKPPDKTTNNKQNKSEVKNVESKVGDSGGKRSKKSKKGSGAGKSLNDIAAGLMGDTNSGTKSQVNGDKTIKMTHDNGNNSKVTKDVSGAKPAKKVDWFDNPPPPAPVQETKRATEKGSSSKSEKQSVLKSDNSFPSLHAMSTPVQSANVPPGFMPNPYPIQSQVPLAPPGFSKPAPPGLSKPMFSVHDYIQPADFTSRNQTLVQRIRTCLETVKDGFDNFKSLSFQFRQGQITSNVYFSNCQLLIGESDFKNIFPELLVLLPDINKQQELWFEHQVVMSGRSSKQQGAAYKNMSPCAKCGQVLLKDDVLHHNLQHGDGQDFPSLKNVTNKGSNGASVKGAWIKAT